MNQIRRSALLFKVLLYALLFGCLSLAPPPSRAGPERPPAGQASPDWQELLRRADYPAAAAALQAWSAAHPEQALPRYRFGLLKAAQDPLSALEDLAQAAALDPALAKPAAALRRAILPARASQDRAYLLLAAGRGLASLEEWDLAAEAFRQAALSRPDFAEAWAYLGEALQHIDRQTGVTAGANPPGSDQTAPAAGLAELHKALDLDPNSVAARALLALYWERQEDYTQALQAIQMAVQLDSANPVLQVQYGSLLGLTGDLEAAELAYRRAVAAAPHDRAYLLYLAAFAIKYDFKTRQVALPAARKAVRMDPQDPASLDMMGQVLIELNDRLNAERFLLRALQADPGFAPAHLHLGLIYFWNGDEGRAFEQFTLARSLADDRATREQADRLVQTYFH